MFLISNLKVVGLRSQDAYPFHRIQSNFSLQPSLKSLLFTHCSNCSASGKDSTRAGSRTCASGSVTSKTGKNAIKSSMDAAVATLNSDPALGDVDDARNPGKGANKRKGQPTSKPPKEKTEQEKELQKIQKDIKAFFDHNNVTGFFYLYLCVEDPN